MNNLEDHFKRMNQWRPDNDPLKTMKLTEYVDKEQRDAHTASVVAKIDAARAARRAQSYGPSKTEPEPKPRSEPIAEEAYSRWKKM